MKKCVIQLDETLNVVIEMFGPAGGEPDNYKMVETTRGQELVYYEGPNQLKARVEYANSVLHWAGAN